MIFLEFNNCHPDPCMNGTCMDQDNTYTCSCFDGYKGTNCDGKLCLSIDMLQIARQQLCYSDGCDLYTFLLGRAALVTYSRVYPFQEILVQHLNK